MADDEGSNAMTCCSIAIGGEEGVVGEAEEVENMHEAMREPQINTSGDVSGGAHC